MRRLRLPFTIRLAVIAFAVILFISEALPMLGRHVDPMRPLAGIVDAERSATVSDDPVLTMSAVNHILYGDRRGGGHLHGVGVPCKSEFPSNWDKDKIVTEVTRIAANDNLGWRQQENGYYTAEKDSDQGIRVRVVLNADKTKVVTAYPVNVPRNPCPVNDNQKSD